MKKVNNLLVEEEILDKFSLIKRLQPPKKVKVKRMKKEEK